MSQAKPLRVLISAIDLDWFLPYQWALLKTYADEEPALQGRLRWLEPISMAIEEFRNSLADERAFTRRFRMAAVDVLGLSCYVWNREEQLSLARLVKRANPKCLVVAGGPDLPLEEADFLRNHPEIDVIVKKDGEIPFRKILRARCDGHDDFRHVPGLVVPEGNTRRPFDTGPAEVIQKFNRSPWLLNRKYLERWLKKNPAKSGRTRVTFETNRGCPYSCAYCNWGSSTMSKLRLFELENLQEEIRWFSGLKIAQIWVADANFGILPRDQEISDAFVRFLGPLERKPEVSFFPAKNHSESTAALAGSLYGAGLMKCFHLGVQTTSTGALRAVRRNNISFDRQRKLAAALKRRGIPLSAQIIMGCPGETVDSWRTTVTDVLALGIEARQVFPFELLSNTPADQPEYRARWEIETMSRKSGGPSGYTGRYICATSTFDRDDYIEMDLYSRMVSDMMGLEPILARVSALISREGEPALRPFFDALFDDFLNNPSYETARRELSWLRSYLRGHVYAVDGEPLFPFVSVTGKKGTKFYQPKEFLLQRCREVPEFRAEVNRFLGEWDLEPRARSEKRVENGCPA